jgi:hypothetical protein
MASDQNKQGPGMFRPALLTKAKMLWDQFLAHPAVPHDGGKPVRQAAWAIGPCGRQVNDRYLREADEVASLTLPTPIFSNRLLLIKEEVGRPSDVLVGDFVRSGSIPRKEPYDSERATLTMARVGDLVIVAWKFLTGFGALRRSGSEIGRRTQVDRFAPEIVT